MTKRLRQYDKMESLANKVEDSISTVTDGLQSIDKEEDSIRISLLTDRVSRLYEQVGIRLPDAEETPMIKAADASAETSDIHIKAVSFPDELSNADIVMTCLAGGFAVLVDFIVVKIPKSVNIVRGGNSIPQAGSPLTGYLRSIGFDSNGKTSAWVKTLEKYFKVPFDKSIIAGEKGFTPCSHRMYSLAHDPSPSGFLWAIKDMVCGTTSYIDKSGVLKSIPTHHVSNPGKLLCPIIWIGHIISDIFTKAGIPIPGTSLLRTLQFGSFGEKKRTLGMVVEYMYLEGYDLRHLATMTTVNAAIETILRIYHVLTREYSGQFGVPGALIAAQKSMYAHRLSKMRIGAYAIAATGNLAKFGTYQWNPLALNLPVWEELLRSSITEYKRSCGTESQYLKAVKNREEINRTFDELEQRLNSI